MKKKISLIIPVFNEEENIENLYSRIVSIFFKIKYDYEIIFVNDGSADNSFGLITEICKKDKKVKAIDLSRNFGKEIAMSAGIDFTESDAAVIIDADMQDPPELIPELIKKWEQGFDVIYAVRKSRKGDSFLKKITAFLFYKVMSCSTKIKIPENTGDFRLLDKKVISALKELPEQNRYMKGLYSWVGFKQTGIYYERDKRFKGISKWNYLKLFDFAIEGLTSFSYLPLKLASFLGIFVSFTSFSYAVYFFIKTIIFGNAVPGYPSLLVIITFLSGIQLFTIGIIGEYIGRTYNESKRRKLYFIRETVGFKRNE